MKPSRIRLGVSSVSLHRNFFPTSKYLSTTSSHHQKKKSGAAATTAGICTKSQSIQDLPLWNVSSSDLDDMFLSNLRLLSDEEEHRKNSNSNRRVESSYDDVQDGCMTSSSSRYQSSLNIFIKPRDQWRHSSIVDYKFCEFADRHSNYNEPVPLKAKPAIYSSYETIYDPLLYPLTNRALSPPSSDSDATLKSRSTSPTSIVSSLNSPGSRRNSTPVMHQQHQQRQHHQRPPKHPQIVAASPSSIIISRPLGRTHNDLTSSSFPLQCAPPASGLAASSPHLPARSHLTIQPSSNILNNLFLPPAQPRSEPHPVPPTRRKHRMKMANQQHHSLNTNDFKPPSSTNGNGIISHPSSFTPKTVLCAQNSEIKMINSDIGDPSQFDRSDRSLIHKSVSSTITKSSQSNLWS